MISIGPFISHPDTPLGHYKKGSSESTLKTIVLGSFTPDGRPKALQCGVNVIMANITPKNIENITIYMLVRPVLMTGCEIAR